MKLFSATTCALAIGIAVATAPATAQTGGWQPPEQISKPTAFLFNAPQLAFDSRGDALVAWQANAGKKTFADPTSGPGSASSRWAFRTGGDWQPERSTARFLPTIAPYGRGRAVALYVRERAPTKTLHAAWIDLTRGRILRTQPLDVTAERIDGFALDVNPTGDAVVAWSALEGRRHHVVVAEARAGRPAFARPRTFSAAGAMSARVDVNSRADAVVAWERDGRLEARVRRGHGAFGKTARVGTTENAYSLSAAAGPGGRAALAWTSQDFCCGDGGEPTNAAKLNFAYASPGGHFHPSTQVDEFSRGSQGSPQVVFDGITGGEIAWVTGFSGAVRAAHFDATAVAAPQTLDTSTKPADGLRLVRLAAAPSGGALVAWIRGDLGFVLESPTTVMAATTPGSGSPFGPAEAASPPDHDVLLADAGIDPRTGRPVAVWSRELGGPNGRVIETAERR